MLCIYLTLSWMRFVFEGITVNSEMVQPTTSSIGSQ